MDCKTAQQGLEILGFRQNDLGAPEFDDVYDHLAACPRCKAHFDHLTRFDQQVASTINKVIVPEDLQSRILSSLTASQHVAVTEDDFRESTIYKDSMRETCSPVLFPKPPESHRIDRRTWLQFAGTSTLGLAAACSTWWVNDFSANQISLNEFRQWGGQTLTTTQKFHGTFLPRLPENQWQTGVVDFGDHYMGMRPNRSGRHTIAAVQISLASTRRVNGVIIMAPSPFLKTVPEIDFFHAGEYVVLAEQGTSTVAWNENDLVFVCCVRGGSQQMEHIERALGSASPV